MTTHACHARLALALVLALLALASRGEAQVAKLNGFQNGLAIDSTVIDTIVAQQTDPPPFEAQLTFTAPFTVEVAGAPFTSAVLLATASSQPGATIDVGSLVVGSVQIDLADDGAPGFLDQVVLPALDLGPTGRTAFSAILSAGGPEVAVQAVTSDQLAGPFFISSTAATRATLSPVFSGSTVFALGPASDTFGTFVFPNNFTFTYWGVNYTQAYVSENGFVQFGSTSQLSAFPNPTISTVNSAPPRIMSFFSDLDVNATTNDVVSAAWYVEGGTRKIKFTHAQVAEFGNQTGGHGGEIVITEQGEISIFVAAYNAAPSINTVVGISRGQHSLALFPSPVFGRDLSADVAAAPVFLGNGVPGVEVFDHGNFTSVQNPLDLIGAYFNNGSGVGPGIVFTPDPTLPPGQFGYVIQ